MLFPARATVSQLGNAPIWKRNAGPPDRPWWPWRVARCAGGPGRRTWSVHAWLPRAMGLYRSVWVLKNIFLFIQLKF